MEYYASLHFLAPLIVLDWPVPLQPRLGESVFHLRLLLVGSWEYRLYVLRGLFHRALLGVKLFLLVRLQLAHLIFKPDVKEGLQLLVCSLLVPLFLWLGHDLYGLDTCKYV